MKQRWNSRVRQVALTALVIVAAGCSGDDSPTSPGGFTIDDADDAAVQASMALGVMGGVVEGTMGSTGSPAPGILGGASGGPGLGVQADTTFTQDGITFTLTRTWFSLTGTEQTLPDAETDSVHATSRVTGTAQTPRYDVTVGHAGHLGIGGIHPSRTEVRINGAMADSLTSHFQAMMRPVERWFVCRTSSVIQDVRWTKSTGTNTYPSSGTITMMLFASRHRDGDRLEFDRTFEATVVVTFNGTAYPDVTVNGTYHYVWDLGNGTIVRAGSV